MNLMFWKVGAKAAPENAQETTVKPARLMANIKTRLAALVQRFTKKSSFRAEEAQLAEPSARPERKTMEPDQAPPDTKNGFLVLIKALKPLFTRKRLLIGGASLLLVGMAYVVWEALKPPPIHSGTSHGINPAPAPAPEKPHAQVEPLKVEPVPEKPHAEPDAQKMPEPPKTDTSELEALKKENAELQAKIESLKKPPPPVSPVRITGGNNAFPTVGAEMTVGNSGAKATAMTLKEAIEAMNASSGDFKKKPAK